MSPFPDFFGNAAVAATLTHMLEGRRIPQTILLSGPEGVGKATLARRFGAALLGDARKIEADDMSLAANQDVIEQREKWTAEKRNDDPLFFSSHPDFVTFVPEGPLRQITIPQIRLLRERAQLKPMRGSHRIFLIDHLNRANEQAANSLLKVLEEPPDHLILIATAENVYDLLPTIRSRAIVFQMTRLDDDAMSQFAHARGLHDADTRIAVADGSPGIAATLDIETFRTRRTLMLAALACAARVTPFSDWVARSESFTNSRSEKLDGYLKLTYSLLADILASSQNRPIVRNRDVQPQIEAIAAAVSINWIERAVRTIDELVLMVRRNVQKTSALDAMIVELRNPAQRISA